MYLEGKFLHWPRMWGKSGKDQKVQLGKKRKKKEGRRRRKEDAGSAN